MHVEADRPGRGARGAARGAVKTDRRAGGGGGKRLVCAACRRAITDAAARIEVDGLHEHSQVNPHGFVWTFGCFAQAPGCAAVGAPSTEFTWFPGHAWQIAQCLRCGTHLGWLWSSPGRRFHGLIVGRIAEEDER
jgi:hypothetical protein